MKAIAAFDRYICDCENGMLSSLPRDDERSESTGEKKLEHLYIDVRADGINKIFHGHDSFLTSEVRLCVSHVGLRFLVTPLAFRETGVVCGILVVLACPTTVHKSIFMLIRIMQATGQDTHEEIVEYVYGRPFMYLVIGAYCTLILTLSTMPFEAERAVFVIFVFFVPHRK